MEFQHFSEWDFEINGFIIQTWFYYFYYSFVFLTNFAYSLGGTPSLFAIATWLLVKETLFGAD